MTGMDTTPRRMPWDEPDRLAFYGALPPAPEPLLRLHDSTDPDDTLTLTDGALDGFRDHLVVTGRIDLGPGSYSAARILLDRDAEAQLLAVLVERAGLVGGDAR